MSGTTPKGLKTSDYLAAGAITSGIVGGSAFLLGMPHGEQVVGFALLSATVLTALSQFLQSKGE